MLAGGVCKYSNYQLLKLEVAQNKSLRKLLL
jgi:hypothetical protein